MVLVRLSVAVVLALTAVACSSTPAPRSSSRPMSDAALQSAWWTWAYQGADADSPVSDTTGALCDKNQSDDVWFVAGSFGGRVERTCAVPAGRPIAGPAVNLVAPTAASCDEFLASASGAVELDDRPITARTVDPVLITYEDDGERLRGFGCGLWFRIDDLPPGPHTLVIEGSSGEFSVKATYALTIR